MQIEKKSAIAHRATYVILGLLSLIASAKITINIYPVPITAQTVVILVIGMLYKTQDAVLLIASYLLLGFYGFNVFATSGFSFASPVLGYLIGFLAAVYVMSVLKTKYFYDNSFKSFLILGLIGNIAIYIPGVLLLSYYIGLEKALYSGFAVFIPSGVIKLLLVSFLLKHITKK